MAHCIYARVCVWGYAHTLAWLECMLGYTRLCVFSLIV